MAVGTPRARSAVSTRPRSSASMVYCAVHARAVGPQFKHANARDGFEKLAVPGSDLTPPRHFPIEALEFRQQHRALDRVHAAADADARVDVAPALAMHADLAHRLRERVIVGEDGAAVAVAAERLGRKEAGAADRREIAALALPWYVAPKLCAASSITGRECRAATALISSMSAGWP